MHVGLSLGVTGRVGMSGVDTDVQAWLVRVAAAGGTVSGATRAAASTFAATAKSAGVWSKLRRLNLCCGDFAASFVPLINTSGAAADTNVNFVAGDYSEALGWASDGTTKYVDTGYTPSEATGGISAYLRTAQTAAATTRVLMGSRKSDSAQIFRLAGNTDAAGVATASHVTGSWGGASAGPNPTITTGGMSAAMWHMTRTGATASALYKNGASVGTSTTNTTPATTSGALYVGAQHFVGTGANGFVIVNTRIAGYAVDTGMTAGEAASFYTAMQAFQAALGRQV